MKAIPMQGPFQFMGARSLELELLTVGEGSLTIDLRSEERSGSWRLTFSEMVAIRWTTEELFDTGSLFVGPGAVFEIEGSAWITMLGAVNERLVSNLKHYVIFTYDNVVEVAAATLNVQ